MVMRIMQSQSTSEPVDYVYAVLGMIPEDIGQSISVDYSSENRLNLQEGACSHFRATLAES
jgi:hypothetical protein